MSNTPVYSWPYQALTDPPNGASLGSGLALGVEATVSGLETRLAAAEAGIAGLSSTFAGQPLFYSAAVKLAAPNASLTLTSIPTNLRSLRLRIKARGTQAVGSIPMQLRINGNTGANYTNGYATGNGFSSTLTWTAATAQTSVIIGQCTGASSTAGWFGYTVVDFIGWDGSGADVGIIANSFTNEFGDVKLTEVGGGRMAAGGPYSRIDVFYGSNWDIGSEMQLLGEYR